MHFFNKFKNKPKKEKVSNEPGPESEQNTALVEPLSLFKSESSFILHGTSLPGLEHVATLNLSRSESGFITPLGSENITNSDVSKVLNEYPKLLNDRLARSMAMNNQLIFSDVPIDDYSVLVQSRRQTPVFNFNESSESAPSTNSNEGSDEIPMDKNLKRRAQEETIYRGTGSSNSDLEAQIDDATINEVCDLEDFPDDHPDFNKWTWNFLWNLQWNKLLGLLLLTAGIIIAITYGTLEGIRALVENVGAPPISTYTYQTPKSIRTSLVDPDTPDRFKHRIGSDGEEWDLVFSDEFNSEGRTFYKGDDQFWEAVDLHYAATSDIEWYDPDHVTTKDGCLRITLDDRKGHNLNFTSGMLQSWNKLCFTQGYFEASIKLPGSYASRGLWPAFWALGNLGRAGYMASTEGVWPYTYESCDAGITANQSSSDGLSYLPGQRLSACVCENEDHPNAGTARGAPEIDIVEGYHNSFAQSYNIAPFDIWRLPDYEFMAIDDPYRTAMNSFTGTHFQEAISALTTSNLNWYDESMSNATSNRNFQRFGMEYRNDMNNNMDNYINFYIAGERTFSITEGSIHPDGNIGWRHIPKEPMSLVLNLGLSESWSDIDFDTLSFPAYFDIDYIRVYQPKGAKSVTCDPQNFPTSEYINKHLNAYMNPNLTSWEQAGYSFPKNSLTGVCGSGLNYFNKM